MSSFGTQHIAYTRTPDNAVYKWNVKYDLTFQNGTVTVGLDIKLTGDNPGALKAQWLQGIKDVWNQRGFLSDGTNLYDIKLDVRFVTSGQDQTVAVHDSYNNFNMLNWYTSTPWDAYNKTAELAAHEVGHMLGNYDEYSTVDSHGNAVYTSTHNHYTTTGTLMSDLTVGGFERYFYAIEFETEQYGFKGSNVLSTVVAQRGYDGPDTWSGGAGPQGYYGFAGDDNIDGNGGNDFLDGGANSDTIHGGGNNDRMFGQSGADALYGEDGNDTLTGGTGNDIMDGGLNSDRFVFDAKLSASSNVDIIVNFSHTDDTIALENAIFKAVGTAIETAEFYAASGATKAHDSSDRIIYNKSSGWLYYDDDGNKSQGHAAVHFATLDTHPGNVNYTDFIVV